MNRYDVINELIKKFNHKSYLEIGTQMRWACFDKIICNNKVCIDPDPKAKADYILTSDDFFKNNKTYFDCIFIDGLHHADQVERDIFNSLKYLNENGTIIVHDCRPKSFLHQAVPRISRHWTGDVWKTWVKLRSTRNDLSMFVVDTCTGCGIIRRKDHNELLDLNGLDIIYSNYELNKDKWLNLTSVEEFIEYLLS